MAGRKKKALPGVDVNGEAVAPVGKAAVPWPGLVEYTAKAVQGQVGRAVGVYERVLRLGEPRGVSLEELEKHKEGWRLRLLAAKEILTLGLRGATKAAGGVKGGRSEKDAEDEPEDGSGVPEDPFPHLR